jgi:hypothetical protein
LRMEPRRRSSPARIIFQACESFCLRNLRLLAGPDAARILLRVPARGSVCASDARSGSARSGSGTERYAASSDLQNQPGIEVARRSPGFTSLKIVQTCTASMETSETPEQLAIRLEMGQGRPVHLFIAPAGRSKAAGKQGGGGGKGRSGSKADENRRGGFAALQCTLRFIFYDGRRGVACRSGLGRLR